MRRAQTTVNESARRYPQRWIRLPRRGVDPDTGLTRAFFYQLINEGKIRTASLRRPGTVRGTRLVWLPSVMELLDRAADHVEAKA
jgi:hypothetical protein